MHTVKLYHQRLHLALCDLLQSKEYAKLLNGKNQKPTHIEEKICFNALHASFIISYARATTSSNIGDIEVKNQFKNLIDSITMKKMSLKQKEIHDFLLKARNQVFAHSDISPHDLKLHKIMDCLGYIDNNVYYGYSNVQIDVSLTNIDFFISEISIEKLKIEKVHDMSLQVRKK